MARRRTELPLATAALVVLGVAAFLTPGGFAWLAFDRDAVAAGQWWRLLTGSFAHYSARHLAGDAAVVAIGGWLVERRDRRDALLLFGGAMLASTVAALLAAPQLRWYAGLSGVGHALAVWLALDVMRMRDVRARLLGTSALAAIAAKLVWGFLAPRLLPGSPDVVVAGTTHAAAAIFAAAAWVVLRVRAVGVTARPADTV